MSITGDTSVHLLLFYIFIKCIVISYSECFQSSLWTTILHLSIDDERPQICVGDAIGQLNLGAIKGEIVELSTPW